MNGIIIIDAFITVGTTIGLFAIFAMIKERWDYIKTENIEE